MGPTLSADRRDVRLAVIGAGFSGITVGLRLLATGLNDFVILERADVVGGVWRDNTYPGVAVDTPSAIYSLSTHPNPRWSRSYGLGSEIFEYTRDLARTGGLEPHFRFGHDVLSAAWDPDANRWVIETSKGTYRARFLVSAAGLVADPSYPDVPGLSTFPGPCFHSSRWDHSLDLKGQRVAVVGTGASAVQFVPAIAPEVAQLHVLQRTASWVLPKTDHTRSAKSKKLRAAVPAVMHAERAVTSLLTEVFASARRFQVLRKFMESVCLKHLERQVANPKLRAKLTPDFWYMCKRPLISNDYLPTFNRQNVTLHTGGLVAVEGNVVVAGDGTRTEVDILILNTGFEIGITSPIARLIRGVGQLLADYWGDDPRAYKGISVPGFPNLFMMQGPNASSGVSSALVFAEAQARYIADAMRRFASDDIAVAQVSEEAEREWTSRIRKLSGKTSYELGGCRSYYQNRKGQNVVMWPGFTPSYQLSTRTFDPGVYRLTPAEELAPSAGRAS